MFIPLTQVFFDSSSSRSVDQPAKERRKAISSNKTDGEANQSKDTSFKQELHIYIAFGDVKEWLKIKNHEIAR